jgi:octanoyl-[GcvH]:protein N-octanoyltransferase
MGEEVVLIRVSFPDRPTFGTAVSEAVLMRVAAGELGATMRLHRPGPELAFSKQDAHAPGFDRAVAAAREHGFVPVLRLAGGRAAAFHEGTLALTSASCDPRPTRGTQRRFEEAAGTIAAAISRLGVDARIGEVPGEYCPGAWSVNARGRVKLAGIGQRLIKGGAHLGTVVVGTGSDRLRAVLEPVYEALELDWDPTTAASVDDEAPEATLDAVEGAILAELSARHDVVERELDRETLRLAERLEAHRTVGLP